MSLRFSTQKEFGLRCLLELAPYRDKEYLTIAEISAAKGISSPNVAKMLRLLRAAGLVQSARGQLGRYKLARLPEQIQISEILITLGGQLFGPRFCRRHAGAASCCSHSSECSIRILRPNIQAAVNRISDHLSLEDLLGTEATLHQHLARVWAPWQQSTD